MRSAALALTLVLVPFVPLAPADGSQLVSPLDLQEPAGAHGLVARPVGAPLGLVVILHGYGHNAESHRGHLDHLARSGYVALAMDYRGSGFPLAAGAADTAAAIAAIDAEYPGALGFRVLYSVSMGTAVASLLLAEVAGFDLWVDNEGLASLSETWAAAKAAAPGIPFAAQVVVEIEAECGGAPGPTNVECYRARSAALTAPGWASPLAGAVLTHGLNDGLVPYNQGREMAAVLRSQGIPVDFYTVADCEPGREGTTLTGHATLSGQGICGHGTESNDHHRLTELSFRLLDELLAGALVPADRELVASDTLGTLPPRASSPDI